MEIIDAKCPNCGSDIKINKAEKTGVCSHCNSQFLIEEAIKNYITNNYIEHATIVKNDFSDEAVYNEVDKYIALYELDDLNRMAPSILKLKEQFPHKGLARIVILHYQFQILLNRTDSVEAFFNEVEEVKKRAKSYHPRSYKDEPPYSKFLWAMNQVEIKYAEDIENLITPSEKEKYEKLINETLLCIETYNEIYKINQEMEEKYAPFKEKRLKQQKKKEKKYEQQELNDSKSKRKTKIVSVVSVLLIAFLVVAVFISNFYAFNKPTISASEKNINISKLSAPVFGKNSSELQTTTNVNVYYVKEYTITGRVVGIKKFLPTNIQNKTISAILCLSWGDYSTKETSKMLELTYSNEDKTFVSSTLDASLSKKYYSVNNLIPDFSNSEIKKLIRSINNNDLIQIKGYLANVSIKDKSNYYSYNSSLSLSDASNEIIYVTSIEWIVE